MPEKKSLDGLVHLYYGNGKGKTTAAIGLGIRAALSDYNVCMIQFMKGDLKYGELGIPLHIPNFQVIQYGRKEFVSKSNPEKIDVEMAQDALGLVKDIIKLEHFDMIIPDEVNYAIAYKLISLKEVIGLIDTKPKNLELVLTGNYAPKKLKEKADYVTEMKNHKHPYQKGILAREGIEY